MPPSGLNVLGTSAADSLDGDSTNDTLTGYAGNDSLFGYAGSDTLYGGDGADSLDGGFGVDSMKGGAGDDIYMVDDLGDIVVELTHAGTDTVESSVTYTLTSNVEDLTLTGNDTIDGTGNSLNNYLIGNNTDNTLYGLAGADTLDGGVGADALYGGAGDDTYIVDDLGDSVSESASEGTDTVEASITYTLTSDVEYLTLTGADSINGTGNDLDNVLAGNDAYNELSGLDGNDSLYGGGGSDSLDGGDGNDVMIGGEGNDTYVVDSASDEVYEEESEGSDTVESEITYTLGDNVENLTLTGADTIDGTGNTLNNHLIGNDEANTLDGLDGNDTLDGGDGDDSLDGGLGNDSMSGGDGNDTYVVDSLSDGVTESSGEGTSDLVQSSVTFTLSANVENLTLTDSAAINGTGNTENNEINGNSANNTLSGLDGNDTLYGNDGDDSLSGDSGTDKLYGGVGNDTIYFGAGDDSIYGGDGNDVIDDVHGTATTFGSNYVEGGVGNDSIWSGAGDDTVLGGDGRDKILSEDGNDLISGGEGVDTLLGGSGNDTLDGGAGSDSLTGGAGSDTFVFSAAPVAGDVDKITDFSRGTDHLSFDSSVLTGLVGSSTLGVLNADAFWSSSTATKAHDGDDRLIYNTTTGALYYDADGSGGAAAIKIAVLTGLPALDNTDFLVYVPV